MGVWDVIERVSGFKKDQIITMAGIRAQAALSRYMCKTCGHPKWLHDIATGACSECECKDFVYKNP